MFRINKISCRQWTVISKYFDRPIFIAFKKKINWFPTQKYGRKENISKWMKTIKRVENTVSFLRMTFEFQSIQKNLLQWKCWIYSYIDMNDILVGLCFFIIVRFDNIITAIIIWNTKHQCTRLWHSYIQMAAEKRDSESKKMNKPHPHSSRIAENNSIHLEMDSFSTIWLRLSAFQWIFVV